MNTDSSENTHDKLRKILKDDIDSKLQELFNKIYSQNLKSHLES